MSLRKRSSADIAPQTKKARNPEAAEKSLTKFDYRGKSCDVTGCQHGDFLVGMGKQNKNTKFQILFDSFPGDVPTLQRDVKFGFAFRPHRKYIEESDSWIYLRNSPFFRNFSEGEIRDYIESNSLAEGASNYLNFVESVRISLRFEYLGDGSDNEFLKLPERDKKILMDSDLICVHDVYSMFVRMNNKESLILRAEHFQLAPPQERRPCSFFLNSATGEIADMQFESTRLFPLQFGNETYGFCDGDSVSVANVTYLQQRMNPRILEIIQWFTPASMKSLLQKCIRVRAVQIEFEGEFFDTFDVTFTVFLKLMQILGGFVPDLQLYVSGGESAFKRLGIILMEDAVVPVVNDIVLTSEATLSILFSAALAFRQFRRGASKFMPSVSLIELVAAVIRGSLESAEYYRYDTSVGVGSGSRSATTQSLSVRLIENLRAFDSDIVLIKQTVNAGFKNIIRSSLPRPLVMQLQHCLDQHCNTNIVYFLPISESSFVEKMGHIWNSTTSQNGRKIPFSPLVDVATAQHELFAAKMGEGLETHYELSLSDEFKTDKRNDDTDDDCSPLHVVSSITLKNKLAFSWLAYGLGLHEKVIDRTRILVFLRPELNDGIPSFEAVRNPGRDSHKKGELSEEMVLEAVEEFRKKLEKNWTLVKINEIALHAKVILRDHKFFCKSADSGFEEEILWDDFCESLYLMKVFHQSQIRSSPYTIQSNKRLHRAREDLSLELVGSGIVENAMDHILAYIQQLPPIVVSRLCVYLSGVSCVIEMHRVTRDGKGMYRNVHWADAGVFGFLQQMCLWLPVVISTDSSLKFTVHHYSFWREVIDLVESEGRISASTGIDLWSCFKFKDRRVLRQNQKEGLQMLMDREDQGTRKHIIFMAPGQGKTLIVARFVYHLITIGTMQPYFVYALPDSAIVSVRNEFERCGFAVNVISSETSKKSSKSKQGQHGTNEGMSKFTVNMISYNYLHKYLPSILELAPKVFAVFDEMHMTLADTLRTSAALDIASASARTIAMTGTVLINEKVSMIFPWLSMINQFPILAKSYMIGAASMISRKEDLNIEVRESDHYVEMTPEQKLRYFVLVPEILGGSAPFLSYIPATKICYEAVTAKMIDFVVELLVLPQNRPVFVAAKDIVMQREMAEILQTMHGKRVFSLAPPISGIDFSNDSTDKSVASYDVVITTYQHSAGYNLQRSHILVTGIFPSNQATREQLLGRILRTGQRSGFVERHIFHTGIMSFTKVRYDKAEKLNEFVRHMAKHGKSGF